MKKKPEKTPLKEYFMTPITRKFAKIKGFIRYKLGFWYCDYCEKDHSPRTINYNPDPSSDGICSLGWQEQTGKKVAQ